MEVENREIFMQVGGKQYHYLPAANDDSLFIDCLEELVQPYIQMNKEKEPKLVNM